MKRYWLSVLLAALIVAGISSYYIQAAANPLPEFVLQRQSGDEDEAAGVILHGHYGIQQLNEQVSIDTKGSKYGREQLLLKKLSADWGGPKWNQLIERHRQFMRGKRDTRKLYEDDNRLAYVDVEDERADGKRDIRFKVSELDIKLNRTDYYEVPMPGGELYRLIDVSDVQVVGEQVKVITINESYTGQKEPHLYTLIKYSGQDQILSYEPSNSPSADTTTNLSAVYLPNLSEPSRYTVFYATQSKHVQDENGGFHTEETRRLLVYDVDSGQEMKVDSKEIRDFMGDGGNSPPPALELKGDLITLVKNSDQGVKVLQVQIKDASSVERLIPLGAVQNMILKDDRIYALVNMEKGDLAFPSLVIADITTGSTVYQGTIELKEPDRYPAETFNNMMIYGLALQ